MEIYRKHRPKFLKDVEGQDGVIQSLKALIKKKDLPHAIMFTGPSGCGKTTLARIIASKVGCSGRDFAELNCADTRGIETIRQINDRMSLKPMIGSSRMWLLDECHKLTNDAQTSLLKMLEDTPGHVYFVLSTTDPRKILSTIQTRCTEYRLALLTHEHLQSILNKILKLEKVKLSEEVCDKLIDVSEGSARKMLVLLNQVIAIEDEDEQMAAIKRGDAKQPAFEIYRALIDPRTKWPQMAAILKKVEGEPEGIRQLILACATSTMLKCGKSTDRAYLISVAFSEPFFTSRNDGLVASCFEVIRKGK